MSVSLTESPSEQFTPQQEGFMQRAIDLAAKGLNTTTPNPRVGCVIVNAVGSVVGEGYHARAGCGHAEVEAIKNAGGMAEGCTAYVTLEPCNHRGRTGPCTEALIKAGITHVIYGMQDPNPQVAGTGIAKLESAGVKVEGPLLEAQANTLNVGYIKRMVRGLPYVRLKLAMSLDGRTAMASGESKWITGAPAREEVQALRARSCAIVTGVGSVLEDDPALTVRSPAFGDEPRQPLRVVVDSKLRSPKGSKVLSAAGDVLLASCIETGAGLGAQHSCLPGDDGRVDLAKLLRELAERGCNEVLVETGATLAGAFLEDGLIDELVVFMAGKLMGSKGRPLVELPFDEMSQSIDLEIQSVQPVGKDWRITAIPAVVDRGENRA